MLLRRLKTSLFCHHKIINCAVYIFEFNPERYHLKIDKTNNKIKEFIFFDYYNPLQNFYFLVDNYKECQENDNIHTFIMDN